MRDHGPRVWNQGPTGAASTRSEQGSPTLAERAGHATKETIMSTAVEPTIDVRPFHIDVPEEDLAS